MGRTITEKIFEAHLRDEPFPGTKVLALDVVLCHEITTPVAINDLVARGKDRVFDPERIKVVIDHVTPAKDSKTAEQGKILREWARRHGIRDFYDIGHNGVCHALFPEKGFIRPGTVAIMGDSHTCTGGAFGSFAAGIGTTDLEVGILKGVCAFREPKTIRVNVKGSLPPGTYAKDLILEIVRTLTTKGATDCVLEFRGPAVAALSMEGRMTLSNMAVEAGATSGLIDPDETTLDYLWPFVKADYGNDRGKALDDFRRWRSDPDAAFERTVDVDASRLVPLSTFGYRPDQVKPVAEMTDVAVDQIYIGSCTNGRLEDLRVAASILKGKRISERVRGVLSPATPHVFRHAMAEGILAVFLEAGFCVTNPTCGACLGMSNGVLAEGEVCASTTNRNFHGRMGRGGMVHLVSPATAAATAIEGRLADPRAHLARRTEGRRKK